MRVAFLLQDLQLRAGVGSVVAHAASLPDAAIVLTREQEHRHWPYPGLASVPILSLAEAVAAPEWDVAVASGGATAAPLLDVAARRHACLLVEADTVGGVSATALPLRFLAPTRAAAALVEGLQPGTRALHVPTVAPAAAAVAPAAARSGVFTVGAAGRPSHEDHAAAVAASEVVLARDDGEDPYDTVLLAVALGVPVVATAIPGRDEVILHGDNGLLVDDAASADAALPRAAALTPRPPAPPARSTIAAALQQLLDEPPPPAHAVARRVAADLATAAAEAEALRFRLERDLAHARGAGAPAAASPTLKARARRVARAAKRRLTR